MKKRLLLVFLSFISGLVFLIFTILVDKNYFTRVDFDLIIKLQDRFPVTYNSVFTLFTSFASFEVQIIILLLLSIWLFLKKRWFSFFILPIYAVAHIIEIFGKNRIDHQGPPLNLLRESQSIFPEWYAHPISSYPSGHSFRIIFLMAILNYLIVRSSKINNNLKFCFFIFSLLLIVLVCAGKIILGEHWFSDVVGGGLLAIPFVFFSLIFI